MKGKKTEKKHQVILASEKTIVKTADQIGLAIVAQMRRIDDKENGI